jgi:flagellar motor switch/type III secretory pathway protein FliN
MRPFQSSDHISGQHPAAWVGVATASSSPAPASDLVRSPETLHSEVAEGRVTTTQAPPDGSSAGWSPLIARLPVELDVAVPVRNFKVRNLIALTQGQLIESQWGGGGDVPLAAREVQLAWCEFEVIETRLAVRVTRLA